MLSHHFVNSDDVTRADWQLAFVTSVVDIDASSRL